MINIEEFACAGQARCSKELFSCIASVEVGSNCIVSVCKSHLDPLEILPPSASYSSSNLALTAVPVPAAVWLFGSALAGLGFMRRKA